MDEPPECPVVRFDHHSPDFAAGLWAVYGGLRGARVAYSETYGGFPVATGETVFLL